LEDPEASFTFELLANEAEESFADLNRGRACISRRASEADKDLFRGVTFTFQRISKLLGENYTLDSPGLPFPTLFCGDESRKEIQLKIWCHFDCQNSMPLVVFREPIKKKNGTQTVAIVIPKALNWWSVDMFVIPKTDVTKVRGRKKMETLDC
jgi:hypothetical protein